ncbi:MAG: FapA family protein [Leptospiraceae bacterium]|nr:FapA family protein [Leptospiraceae bacterium]MCP5494358.1 FapA family protein [Leptospiraceae bacterium]
MDALKTMLLEQEEELERREKEMVEVYADSISECLKLASHHLGKEIYQLDYDILKRGKRGFIFSEPFHIKVFPLPEEDSLADLQQLDQKLTGGSGKLTSTELKKYVIPKDKDGWACIKNFRSGVYLAIFPPIGNGKKLTVDQALKKFKSKGIQIVKEDKVRQLVEEAKGEYTRMWNSSIKAMAEGSVRVDINKDSMRAVVTMIPPKLGGRDLEVSDVTHELKKNNVLYGIKEDEIKKMIDDDQYNIPFTAAIGDSPVNGKNAQIVYHVRTERALRLKEDAAGKIDFKNLDIIENVVAGQLLAEKIPAEKGKYGRNLFNEILDAKDGIDVELHQGRGTILSDDKKQLKAEYNGQVIFAENRINVEDILKVGDVGIKTGNITFLGSVVVTGNVEDNYMIKASGTVEIYGTVEKAQIEADSDIIIRQGISGKDEARVESISGNVISKFIERATVITDKDVLVQEGIMHSNVSAGGKIVCNGKRAQIVGGDLRATQKVSARILGSPSNPATKVTVGVNPKILKQIEDIMTKRLESVKKLESLIKTQKTLKARQEEDPTMFSEENKEYLKKLEVGIGKLEGRIKDIDKELEKLNAYMEETSEQGRVYIEKTIFRGVYVRIKNADYEVKKDTQSKIFYLENDKIKQTNFVDPDKEKEKK